MLERLCRSREFRLQLERSRSRLYRLAYSWCHSPELADDLTQETLSKALKRAHQLKDLEALNSWLFRILSNCWHDYLRKRQETMLYDEEQYRHEVTPESLSLRQQDIDRVRQAVQALVERKPRGYVAILSHFQRLLRLESDRRTATIESAVPLSDALRNDVQGNLTRLYGQGLQFRFRENPSLIGGLRIQVGSDVLDGTVQSRLKDLQESF